MKFLRYMLCALFASFAKVEAYSGQVTEGQLYEGEDDADDGDWFSGPLKFKRHIDDDLRRGSDGRAMDDYAVIDPLKQGAEGGYRVTKDDRDGSARDRTRKGANSGHDGRETGQDKRHRAPLERQGGSEAGSSSNWNGSSRRGSR